MKKGGKYSSFSFARTRHSFNVPSSVSLEEVNTLTWCALKRSVTVLKVLPNGKAALTLDKRGSAPM